MITAAADLNTSNTPITTDAALKKALQLLDECHAVLAMAGDRRYTHTPNSAGAPRISSTRGLMHRIESFTDITRTFVLSQ